MRWKKRKKPIHGDTRVASGFLLFPKCINNEYRWLERADWLEEYHRGELIAFRIHHPPRWKPVEWVK